MRINTKRGNSHARQIKLKRVRSEALIWFSVDFSPAATVWDRSHASKNRSPAKQSPHKSGGGKKKRNVKKRELGTEYFQRTLRGGRSRKVGGRTLVVDEAPLKDKTATGP